jgi:hypothetical protein
LSALAGRSLGALAHLAATPAQATHTFFPPLQKVSMGEKKVEGALNAGACEIVEGRKRQNIGIVRAKEYCGSIRPRNKLNDAILKIKNEDVP